MDRVLAIRVSNYKFQIKPIIFKLDENIFYYRNTKEELNAPCACLKIETV